MTFLYISIAVFVLIFVPSAIYNIYVAIMTFRGIYPKNGSATMRDVERLIDQEQYGLAQLCYRRLTKSSLKDTTSAIAHMRKERMNINSGKTTT
jgi:hypothetical protein